MSDSGLFILNYQAGSIFEVDCGVRNNYDTTRAMLKNSLFSDFLLENGLHVHKEKSTRDIICVKFDYGSRSYEQEHNHIERLIKETEINVATEQNPNVLVTLENKLDRLHQLQNEVEANKENFKKISADKLRTKFYEEGVTIHYSHGKTIHYRMLYRTPGKAKKGECMFIRDSLYKKARNYLYMGIKLPKQNAPIVEMGAYSSLVTSAIEGRIKIEPEQILVLKDVDAKMLTNVICVNTNEKRQCVVKHVDNYEVTNTLFDGQALIDESIFPANANGYILLRQHFCKAAAFVARIQLFFRDKFGEDYETAEVTDMWGGKHLAKDIKLITTDNALKWLKIPGITYDYWSDWVRANGSYFGIVKTAHPSKLGEYQRMSYQMVNALDINTMPDVMSNTLQYVQKLKQDDNEFLEFLRQNQNFSNDYEPLVAICEKNPEFVRCDYFRERKRKILYGYTTKIKFGKVLQNADNLVIVGSPYAMLMHSVGEDPLTDPTFEVEEGVMQCWTERFGNGEYLAEFRSPFNSCNNLGLLHNKQHYLLDKYFPFGKQIVAVNMIGTEFQSRNNGSDMDSDSVYVTNQQSIVNHARYCMKNYPTVVNEISKSKNTYSSTPTDFAKVDNQLAAAQLAIGESSNLAQLCLTYTYNFDDPKYKDYAAILAVVAQVAIDSAKRSFDVDITSEIARIKDHINVKENGYPEFWRYVRPDLADRINKKLKCPMNEVCATNMLLDTKRIKTIPFNEFLCKRQVVKNRKVSYKVENLINKYSWLNYQIRFGDDEEMNLEKHILLHEDFEMMIDEIRHISMGAKYSELFYWLLNRAFLFSTQAENNSKLMKTTIAKNKPFLIRTLYEINKTLFLDQFLGHLENFDTLISTHSPEDTDGELTSLCERGEPLPRNDDLD